MRRYNRAGGSPTTHASKINGGPVPDPMSLIRAYDSETNPTRPIRPSPLTASTIQGLPLDLLDRLRSFPLFLSAPDSFLAAIGAHLRPQLYQPHDYILTEGDDAKAMYWLVRGAVRVTSRDGESTYAELKPGAFFGEIGILMDIPRTATIIANMRSLVVRLNKEDLKKELPNFPAVERAIMEEAKERLSILERKKKEIGSAASKDLTKSYYRNGKRPRDGMDNDVEMIDSGVLRDGEVISANKKRKSPSPGLAEAAALSALGSGSLNVRLLLKELPLFSSLPPDILHFIGLNAQPRTFPPFTDIIQQGSQGRDVFFIVRGEVEVVNQRQPEENGHVATHNGRRKSIAGGEPSRYSESSFHQVRARLRSGQYFGEVTSLSLAPRRTATVRSVSSVECLMISGDVLNELWQRCSPDLRRQVEAVAKQRLEAARDNDVSMSEAGDNTPAIDELAIGPRTPRKKSVPTVTFTETTMENPLTPSRRDEKSVIEPYDPDPFLNVDLDNMRSRSRRGSLAPPPPDGSQNNANDSQQKPQSANGQSISPSPLQPKHSSTPPESQVSYKRPRIVRRPSRFGKGLLPDTILISIFQHLDIHELMKTRLVSMHWLKIITTSADVLHTLDLTKYNRKVTDSTLTEIICPFVGSRPRFVDISNCFHVTDEGFIALASICGANVKVWRMKSVWDITGQAVLEMVNRAKDLEEVDLSNCRKVGDNLLARVVGWVVPETPPNVAASQQQMNGRHRFGQKGGAQQNPPPHIPPGTVVGCPKLKRLTLSYCKHITDRSMAHIAVHAASRLEQIDLTRCTSITDVGFQHWSVYAFPRLSKLCLADCTYLTDNAIVYLTNAAKGLRELDLSFCCALSDTATEVLALGLPSLIHLNLAFCGSAVSDASLRCISLHLLELRQLSVRGCVRVTRTGVEAVVEGCRELEVFDVSQCKNLGQWLDSGGVEGVKSRGRRVRFEVVADGRWRTGT
ncbi:cyclic nucleotide-binding domain-containing protein [Lepidopterella palustris CBS 459.81]|uniref:Cyclic nucleotide-binding domain-containing protein n=1 Tax=Lepidopterella palustris CBS 459.81 TaxID=1314670 RepID=A0A8E2JEK5_9PEZI|nr:cyclic nucleotide-binding domain-containing protein [Lepidopterella palustris CBS 459.81]